MKSSSNKKKLGIWGLALGYFLFYVPYSALTKALSKGLLPGSDGAISGFEMLPTVVIGTFLMLLFLITIMGWWKYAGTRKLLGLNIPFATNKWTLLSGLATSFIIVTTTLAYSFTGISIVFAALLMRGGVLTLAPLIDKAYGRKVHWYSWAALALSMIAISGSILFDLQQGFTSFISSSMALPALLIGSLYACLYIFGSRIYLDHRENTFCIPVNRCASLLAGVVAAFILSAFFEGIFVSSTQLLSSGILITAILFLSVPFFQKSIGKTSLPSKVYLFVCPGNTGRSPMAQAICIAHLKGLLLQQGRSWDEDFIKVKSAGLSVKAGAPMSPNAQVALEKLGVERHEHQAANLNVSMVKEATEIFCMSEEHRQQIIEKFPLAKDKVNCLDPVDNIIIPHGRGAEAYHECATYLKNLISQQFEESRIV